MAYFKLSLITTKSLSNSQSGYFSEFLIQPISEFYSKMQLNKNSDGVELNTENTFCYSYDENFSVHTNSQKELTFSLDRYFIREDRMEYNPFAPYMSVGTQLLLEDKYHNHHLMTITQVKYNFYEHNITYNITCQDSFTYQATRQNDGYTIENDSSSADFIGARDVDWWVRNKIDPECHLVYTYLNLADTLYLSEDNEISVVKPVKPKKIKRILKQAYNPKDYDSIPFAASGSASSILIELGDQLGLSLKIFEYFTNDHLYRYFWYEPSKLNEVSGLKYSPYSDIRDFGLVHDGSSLTTVLNVQPNEIGDELISLLPPVPKFFKDHFISEDWKNSSYEDGMFTSLVKGKTFQKSSEDLNPLKFTNEEVTLNDAYNNGLIFYKENNLYIPFHDENLFAYQYKYPNLQLLDTKITAKVDGKEHTFTQNTYPWDIRQVNKEIFDHTEYTKKDSLAGEDKNKIKESIDGFFKQLGLVGKNSEPIEIGLYEIRLLNKEIRFWIGNDTGVPTNYPIKVEFYDHNEKLIDVFEGNEWVFSQYIEFYATKIIVYWPDLTYVIFKDCPEPDNILSYNISLNISRDYTEQELHFASIADQCPWLENKILDFNYFLNHNLLTKMEYAELTNLIYDNLRVVNGTLLVWADAYYQALSQQIQVIADITNSLDLIGATFQTDIVNKYQQKNQEIDTQDFDSSYSIVFAQNNLANQKKLLNYNSLHADYVQKYVSAEQRFLENIYNFDTYFNSKVDFLGNNLTYTKYVFELPPEYGYSFDSENMLQLDLSWRGKRPFPEVVYKKDDNAWRCISEFVTSENYMNYYVKKNTIAYKEADPLFDESKTYYDQKYTEISHNDIKLNFINKNKTLFLQRKELNSLPVAKECNLFNINAFNINGMYFDNDFDPDTLWKINHPLSEYSNGENIFPLANFSNYQSFLTPVKKNTDYKNFGNANNSLDAFIKNIKTYTFEPTHPAKYYISEDDSLESIDNNMFANSYYYGSYPVYYNTELAQVFTISSIPSSAYYNKTKKIRCIKYDSTNKQNPVLSKNLSYYFIRTNVLGNIYNDTTDILSGDWQDFYLHYPLEHNLIPLDCSDDAWQGQSQRDITYLIKGISFDSTNNAWVQSDKNWYIFEIAEYELVKLTNDIGSNDMSKIVDINGMPIDWNSYDLCRGLYEIREEAEDFEPSEDMDLPQEMYKKENDKFVPIPTWTQITADGAGYYIPNTTFLTKETFFDEAEFNVPIYNIATKEKVSATIWYKTDLKPKYILWTEFKSIGKFSSQPQELEGNKFKFTKDSVFTFNDLETYSRVGFFSSGNTTKHTLYAINNQIIFKAGVEYHTTTIVIHYIQSILQINNTLIFPTADRETKPLNQLTNGQFWYQYQNDTIPKILEQTALIETNLTQYWTQAYTSSKYAHYFIPEHWQSTFENQSNPFFNEMFAITDDSISLLYNIIPKVELLKSDQESFRYLKFMKQSTSNIVPDTYNDYRSLAEIIDHNAAVKQMCVDELGLSPDAWSCQIINDNTDLTRRTYYRAINNTGLSWQKALLKMVPEHAECPDFGGLHEMMVKFFNKNYYTNNPMTEYFKAKNQQQNLWTKIYKTFPNIILEKTYSNANATTSAELLALSKNAMRDFSTLERNYNIGLIDASHLRGYEGQELKIGLPIEIAAEEYYDGYDDIKTSLNQYLFITDISYKLRSDSDISITVNSIKYEDKLIRQLVKLIR